MNAKPFVLTYTNMNTYLICPEQFFRRYLKKDLPFSETTAMKRGNEVHTAFEYRVGGGKPLPYDMIHWEPIATAFDNRGAKCELKLGVTAEGKPTGFFDKDVWLRGKADITIINGEVAYLPDLKTGKPREDPFELEVQALLTYAANPYLKKVFASYVWLKENRLGQIHDVSDVNSTWARVNNIAEEIKDCMQTGEWEKKRGPLCKWCAVSDCEFNQNPDFEK